MCPAACLRHGQSVDQSITGTLQYMHLIPANLKTALWDRKIPTRMAATESSPSKPAWGGAGLTNLGSNNWADAVDEEVEAVSAYAGLRSGWAGRRDTAAQSCKRLDQVFPQAANPAYVYLHLQGTHTLKGPVLGKSDDFPSLGEAAKAPQQKASAGGKKKKGTTLSLQEFVTAGPAAGPGRSAGPVGRASDKEILLSLPTASRGKHSSLWLRNFAAVLKSTVTTQALSSFAGREAGDAEGGGLKLGGGFREYGGDRGECASTGWIQNS
jgi:hypothetical protein